MLWQRLQLESVNSAGAAQHVARPLTTDLVSQCVGGGRLQQIVRANPLGFLHHFLGVVQDLLGDPDQLTVFFRDLPGAFRPKTLRKGSSWFWCYQNFLTAHLIHAKLAMKTGHKRTPEAEKPMARYRRPSNDRLSPAFADIVPPNYRGSDRFLDVVTWNIRYFHHRDKKRLSRVIEILSALNADIFVLQEILEDSLEPVAEGLDKKGAGYYLTAYGTTGGNQRIAVMYDLDWIRSKDDIRELFGKGQVRASDGKDAFPRLPLWCNFTSLSHEGAPFDFQLLGVHLKSQRGGGGPQRQKAAGALANWLCREAPRIGFPMSSSSETGTNRPTLLPGGPFTAWKRREGPFLPASTKSTRSVISCTATNKRSAHALT